MFFPLVKSAKKENETCKMWNEGCRMWSKTMNNMCKN